MSDLLLDELPTRWHGHEIVPDFRPMVWLVNTYVRGQTGDDPIGFAVSALWRFYKDPHCFLNDPQKIIDAYGYMIEFYKAGEKAAESAAAESSTAPSSGLAFDYQCDAGYIVAAFQQAYGIDLTADTTFCLGNCCKYLWRYHSKGRPLEDLEKARWYLCRVIDYGEKIAWTRQQYDILTALVAHTVGVEARTWAKLKQGYPDLALALIDELIKRERDKQ
mgnify:CR=1 FL=1